MALRLSGIVVIVGNYGSGKSEVAINLAVHHRQAGEAVRLADLDVVNPYFRSREAAAALGALGITVILPPAAYRQAELPVLSPEVAGAIQQPGGLTLLDVGGDDVGARVLAALAEAFAGRPYRMLQVVNPMRPATATTAGCLRIRREIEAAAGLEVDGLIGNANLIDETSVGVVLEGVDFMRALARASGLPLVCVTAPEDVAPDLEPDRIGCPVLAIRRQLVPPWKKAERLVPTTNRRPSGRPEE